MTGSAFLSCLAAICLLGTVPIFDKIALAHLESRQYFLARFYVMFILLLTPLVFYFDEIRVAVWRSDRRLLWALAGSPALTLAALYFYYRAMGEGEASRVVPLCASYPLLTFLVSSVALKEPVSAAKLAGTAMIVGGSWLLVRS